MLNLDGYSRTVAQRDRERSELRKWATETLLPDGDYSAGILAQEAGSLPRAKRMNAAPVAS